MDISPRVTVGNEQTGKPYSASALNISAISFGSLSANAVQALNLGAAKGNFHHDTGEGDLFGDLGGRHATRPFRVFDASRDARVKRTKNTAANFRKSPSLRSRKRGPGAAATAGWRCRRAIC